MRIGFDVSQTAEPMAGCGIVADQFLRHLVEVSPNDTFIPYPVFGNYHHPNFANATRPTAPNVVGDEFERSWEEVTAPWRGSMHGIAARLGAPDVVHANNFWYPRGLDVPVIYTVYDLSAVEAALYHTEQNRMVCVDGMFEASLWAAQLVAISHYSRDRFLHWFPHVHPNRISVIHLAARPSLTRAVSESETRRVLERIAVKTGGFWLSVGTIEPRKNYVALLEAYAAVRLRAEAPIGPLCIAGLKGWLDSSLEPHIRRLGLGDQVRCLGYVDDGELAVLYRHCLAFIYPSRYEGFGLPVIEAMACGAAVIATASTSLPEVVGDAGWLVDLDAAEGYASAMMQVLQDSERRATMRAAAMKRAARFSWKASAQELRRVYATARSSGQSGSAGGQPPTS